MLNGELNIYAAGAAAEAVLAPLREGVSSMDLGEVSEIDGAGLQLLLMANRVTQGAGRELRIAAASKAVRETLDLVQCDELRNLLGSPK